MLNNNSFFKALGQILLFVLMLSQYSDAQNRNSVWVFGDSSLVDFGNAGSPVTGVSGMDGRGSCVSISDTSGSLLFYAFTRATIFGNSGLVYNKQHELMVNGDDILGQGWYNEMVILPSPNNSNQYYLFSIGVTNSSDYGLFYSVIDMSLDGGLGAVTQKNIMLDSVPAVDCLKAIKHGNGRDWWLLFRKWDPTGLTANKRYYKYLIDPTGVALNNSEAIGSTITTNAAQIAVSSDGSKIAFINRKGVINIMNFDRCTGDLSQVNILQEESSNLSVGLYFTAEFSPNGQFLYVTRIDTVSILLQYDLSQPNPTLSRDTIYTFTNSYYTTGTLRLAPDNKIYLSNAWAYGYQWNYPYQDSAYTFVNMNLSVINDPDQPGSACNFQPYSFSLGGKRTYWGLPNNPDYELPSVAGSPCDTLVGMNEFPVQETHPNLFVYYSLQWQTAFINANQLSGTSGKLQVFDASGKLVFEESTKINPPYYTKNLNCTSFAKGIYVVTLESDEQQLVRKFVVE